MDITYSTNKVDLADLKVTGFFEDWPDKPNENILRRSIENADYIVLAIDTKKETHRTAQSSLCDRSRVRQRISRLLHRSRL